MADLPTRASAFTRLVASGAASAHALTIAECRNRALVTIGGAPDDAGFVAAVRAAIGAELPREPGGVAAAGHGWTFWTGPSEWLHVAPGRDGWAIERDLAHALAPHRGAAIDVSHGRAVLRLTGAAVRDVLAQGCPIDLHPEIFPAGRCAQTLFGKIGVLLHAIAPRDRVELYVSRSYADAVADALCAAARAVGVVIGTPVE